MYTCPLLQTQGMCEYISIQQIHITQSNQIFPYDGKAVFESLSSKIETSQDGGTSSQDQTISDICT